MFLHPPSKTLPFCYHFATQGCYKPKAVEALADLTARHHLKPVHIAELYCGDCGFFRLGVPSLAPKFACPGCGTLRPATALGTAYTAQPAPLVRYLCRAVPRSPIFGIDSRGYRSRFRFAHRAACPLWP